MQAGPFIKEGQVQTDEKGSKPRSGLEKSVTRMGCVLVMSVIVVVVTMVVCMYKKQNCFFEKGRASLLSAYPT